MNCDTCHSLIPEYLYEELDASARTEFETAMASCPDCSAELQALQRTVVMYRTLEPIEVSERLHSDMMRAARVHADVLASQSVAWWRRLFSTPMLAAAATVSAAAVAAFVVAGGPSGPSLDHHANFEEVASIAGDEAELSGGTLAQLDEVAEPSSPPQTPRALGQIGEQHTLGMVRATDNVESMNTISTQEPPASLNNGLAADAQDRAPSEDREEVLADDGLRVQLAADMEHLLRPIPDQATNGVFDLGRDTRGSSATGQVLPTEIAEGGSVYPDTFAGDLDEDESPAPADAGAELPPERPELRGNFGSDSESPAWGEPRGSDESGDERRDPNNDPNIVRSETEREEREASASDPSNDPVREARSRPVVEGTAEETTEERTAPEVVALSEPRGDAGTPAPVNDLAANSDATEEPPALALEYGSDSRTEIALVHPEVEQQSRGGFDADPYAEAAEQDAESDEDLADTTSVSFDDALASYIAGDYAQAVTGFESVLSAGIREEACSYYIGASYFQLGQADRAEQVLDTHVQNYPTGPFADDARQLLEQLRMRIPDAANRTSFDEAVDAHR